MMINSSVIMGRLSADTEIRETSNGTQVLSFTIACDRAFSKKGEERQADWIDCVAWSGTAEFINKFFKKGDLIAIRGHIQTRSFDDKNGNRRKATEVVVDEASFCGSKNSAPAKTDDDGFKEIPMEEELPF